MTCCPRCDYDLTGQIQSWKEECPLEGRCPECGLRLAWARLFLVAPPPAWSVEHAPPGLPTLIPAALRSATVALQPWALWRSLTLSMPVVPRRLAGMLGVWAGAMYLFAVAAMMAAVCLEVSADRAYRAALAASSPRGAVLLPSLGYADSCLVTLFNEPWRWLAPHLSLSLYFPALGGWGRIPAAPVVMIGLLVLAMPATLATLPGSLRRAKVRGRHLLRLSAYWLVWLPVLTMIPALGESAHRQAHYWSWTFRSPGAAGGAPPGGWRRSLAAALDWYGRHDDAMAVCSLAGILLIFWGVAAKRYLHLPHAWPVALSLSAVSILFTACAAYFGLGAGDDLLGLLDEFAER